MKTKPAAPPLSVSDSAAILSRLEALGDPARAKNVLRFFKAGPGGYAEGDHFLGISTPQMRRLAKEFQDAPPAVAEELLQSPWHEARVLALLLLVAQHDEGDEAQRAIVQKIYMRNLHRVNNWDLVDCSAPTLLGAYYAPSDLTTPKRLAKSHSLWERRVAIVSTLYHIRQAPTGPGTAHTQFTPTLAIAEMLLGDGEDLIHKAVGWMLREVGKKDVAALEAFLTKYYAVMPRTMLRYAIERFPEARRQAYLKGTV